MSIPSIIAVPTGAARYVANELHPRHLWDIVQRDGITTAAATLVDADHGWSSVDAAQRDTLHPLLAHSSTHSAVAGYGVAHSGLTPIDDWLAVQRSNTLVRAVFVLDATVLRIHAHGLHLSIPYVDPSPNWSRFEHVVFGGPPPRLQLVRTHTHPSAARR